MMLLKPFQFDQVIYDRTKLSKLSMFSVYVSELANIKLYQNMFTLQQKKLLTEARREFISQLNALRNQLLDQIQNVNSPYTYALLAIVSRLHGELAVYSQQ